MVVYKLLERRSYVPAEVGMVNVTLLCEAWQEFHKRVVRMLEW